MYCLTNIIAIAKSTGRDGWDIQLAREHDKCITNLVGKPEGKRPTARPRRKREDNKMHLKETECESVNWIHLAQDRDKTCKHGNLLLGSKKSGQYLDYLSVYRLLP